MSNHVLAQPAAATRSTDEPILRFVMDRYVLVPAGVLLALIWANTRPESYFRFAHAGAFAVNEVGMALFLALVAQRVVESTMAGGALHAWRRRAMPVVAAAGGLAGSAGMYLWYVHSAHELVLSQAWPTACAVDIVFGYYLLQTIYRRDGATAFFLLLAVSMDVFGLMVVAFAPTAIHLLTGAGLMAAALGLAALLRWRQVRVFWPYLVLCGALSWWACYWAGLHPALALVPIVPFLPHGPRTRNLFADPVDHDRVHASERQWNAIVQIVLFFFGLVNAGVLLHGIDTGAWAILCSTLVGRPLGIVAAVALARAAGLHLPEHIGWRELLVIAFATSSGLTFALFFAAGVLPIGAVLTQIKLGLLSTVAGALIVVGVARMLRVGRFARSPSRAG